MTIFLVNGQHAHSLALTDRALHYGDGIFETIAVINGQPLHWQAHIQRLLKGCQQLAIPAPDVKILFDTAINLIKQHTEDKAVLKIIYSRGSGGRGYQAPLDPQPTQIIALYPWPTYPDLYHREGVAVRICKTVISRNIQLAGIKHLNRLEQVLARSEWQDNTIIQEGLMLDEQDSVIEGTMTNLFIIKKDVLATPSLQFSGVAGIIREMIINHAHEKAWPCRIKSIKLPEVMNADECFLCNSIIGIWPIRKIEDTLFNVGKYTRYLQNLNW